VLVDECQAEAAFERMNQTSHAAMNVIEAIHGRRTIGNTPCNAGFTAFEH
jgi:hypothetical protein